MSSKAVSLLNEIPLTDGTLVISKDACPFQDVIDGFADAGRISVVTFNISKWRNQLLGALKKTYAIQRLITNIPNRRENYSYGGMKAAEETIRLYLNRSVAW